MKRLLLVLVVAAACAPPPPIGPVTTPTSTAIAQTDVCHVGGTTYCVQNPDVRQDTIASTICQRGWTKTIRPPVAYTDDLKRQQMALYNLSGPLGDYEEDHRLPLELGGAPRDPFNLSPEFGASPNPKDHDEDAVKRLVCAHKVSLVAAQVQFIAKWLAPYPEYAQ